MPTVSLGVGECYCFQGGVREAVRSLLKLHFSTDGAERDFYRRKPKTVRQLRAGDTRPGTFTCRTTKTTLSVAQKITKTFIFNKIIYLS